MRLGLGITTMAIAATVLLTAPSGAAAESCVYEGVQTTSSKDKAGYKRPGLTRQQKVEHALLCLTNLHRVRNGLQPLLADTRLDYAARLHSTDMVNRGFFDHINPEGADPSTRTMAAGYPGGAGENIAANGDGTAASLFTQWVNSAGHNANMLGAYLAAGMGVAPGFPGSPGSGSVTGTQMFGFAPPNTGYTGFDLYANNQRCANAKLMRLTLLENHIVGKKGIAPRVEEGLRGASRQIRKTCKPPV